MKSHEIWCYRFSRQCVVKSVARLSREKMVGSDAAVGSDATVLVRCCGLCKVCMSKIKNSTYFPKRVLSKIKKQIQLNIFYISSHAGRFIKSFHTDRRYSTSNFFFSSIRT